MTVFKPAQKINTSDLLFDIAVNGFLILTLLVVIYPLYFVVIASFSDPRFVNSGQVILLPKGITFEGYRMIFNDARIWNGYVNTIIYTVGFGALGAFITLLAGYALSRKELYGRKLIASVFLFAMYFHGGLIPTYLVVKQIHLQNNPLIMIIMGSLNIYYVFITRSFFESTVSEELYDASRIDGCSTSQFFFRIVLPLSQAIIAVIVLFYAVTQWNSYFKALVYLNDKKYYPLQLILRDLLIKSQNLQDQIADLHSMGVAERIAEQLKYGTIIVSVIPVMILYPFLQKYFVQGVMIGSVKG